MSAPIFDENDLRRHRLFNGPQVDPTHRAKKLGMPHYARRTSSARALMPDDFMPAGPHAGKHLRAVPTDYLLWVNAQPWAKSWSSWQLVADYIDRFLTDASDSDLIGAVGTPAHPIIFIHRIVEHSKLHTLPCHTDKLATFALAVLDLRPDWLQHKEVPHYILLGGKQFTASEHGAAQIDRQQMAQHQQLWREFRNSQPQPLPDPSTHERIPKQRL